MTKIELLIYSSAFGLLFAVFSGIPQRIKRIFKLSRLKPFDCELCMTFWACLTMSFFYANFALLNSVALASVASVITITIKALYDRIK